MRRPLVYRFYNSFVENGLDRPQYLQEHESRMFESLEIKGR